MVAAVEDAVVAVGMPQTLFAAVAVTRSVGVAEGAAVATGKVEDIGGLPVTSSSTATTTISSTTSSITTTKKKTH